MLQQRALQASEPRIPGQIRQKPWYLPQKNVHRYTAFAYNFSDPHIQIFLSIEGKKCQILKLIFRYFMWFKTKRYKLRNLFAIVLSSGQRSHFHSFPAPHLIFCQAHTDVYSLLLSCFYVKGSVSCPWLFHAAVSFRNYFRTERGGCLILFHGPGGLHMCTQLRLLTSVWRSPWVAFGLLLL